MIGITDYLRPWHKLPIAVIDFETDAARWSIGMTDYSDIALGFILGWLACAALVAVRAVLGWWASRKGPSE